MHYYAAIGVNGGAKIQIQRIERPARTAANVGAPRRMTERDAQRLLERLNRRVARHA